MKRLLSSIALALVATLALAACGSDNTDGVSTSPSTASPSAADHNKADATFVRSMIPHHEQAVQMAKMATSHAASPEVRDLAATIEAAQGPEITTMTGWLTAWGEKAMAGSMPAMKGDTGMMSDSDMSRLDAATGAAFDRMFLTMMIGHHSGAIQMARTEQTTGENPDAIALARAIEAAQAAQIAEMRTMLTR